jgi:hypothetical protein
MFKNMESKKRRNERGLIGVDAVVLKVEGGMIWVRCICAPIGWKRIRRGCHTLFKPFSSKV